MFCPKCGTQNENDAKFCASCGMDLSGEATVSVAGSTPTPTPAPSPAPAPNPAPAYNYAQPAPAPAPAPSAKKVDVEKLKKNKKPLFIAAAALVIIVLLIVIIACASGGSKFSKNEYNYYTLTDDDETYTVYCNRKEIGSYTLEEGETISDYVTADHGRIYAFTLDESIVYITNKEVKIIDEKADVVWLSKDGKTILYTYRDPEDGINALFTYDVKKEKATEIDDEVANVKPSPDCATILYNKYDDDEVELYLYKKGKSEKIGKDLVPVTVDNKAKYIYVYNDDSSLYILDSKYEKSKISNDYEGDYIVNDDRSQIIFVADDKVYFSNKGGDKVKLFNTDSSYVYRAVPAYTYADTSDLGDYVYYSGDTYYYFNAKKTEAVKLCSGNINGFTLSADGKTAYFIDIDDIDDESGAIVKVNVGKNPEKTELIKEEVTRFVLTSGGVIYYGNEDEELRYLKGKKDEKVADDMASMSITAKDLVLFKSDDALYYVKGKTNKEKLAEDVYSYSCTGTYAYYTCEYDSDDGVYDVYVSDGGSKFSEAAKESKFSTGTFMWARYW